MALSNLFCRAYACGAIRSNDASTEELSYKLGALSAEVAGGGVRINIIPKVGGNIFSGSVFGNIAPEALTHSNFSQRLKDLGLQAPNRVSRIWDTSAAIGGPIVRDTLWFFQANRYWGTDKLVADAFWEIDPTDAVYEPDLNRQAVNDQWNLSNNLRLTYQVNPKNRGGGLFRQPAPLHVPLSRESGLGAGSDRTMAAARELSRNSDLDGTTEQPTAALRPASRPPSRT